MITHEQLLELWEKDAEIDKNNLDTTAASVPKLHHKYLKIYLDLRAKKIAFNHKLEAIRKDKELYYTGQATSETYKEKPFHTVFNGLLSKIDRIIYVSFF